MGNSTYTHGLSMNTIIIISIILLILVIISFLMLRNDDCWEYNELQCESSGIICLTSFNGSDEPNCFMSQSCENITHYVCGDWREWHVND